MELLQLYRWKWQGMELIFTVTQIISRRNNDGTLVGSITEATLKRKCITFYK